MASRNQLKIERGARVVASDGEVGRVTHVIVDPETREVTELVVEHEGHERLLPIGAVASADGATVRLRSDRRQVRLAESFRREDYRGVDDERADAESRGRAERGGAALREAQDDAVVVDRVPGAAAPPAVPRGERLVRRWPTEGEVVVPVAEERLEVEKREAELGAVEVRKRVVEEQRRVPVELAREEVHVERRDAGDRPVRPGDRVFQEGTLRVPVRGEKAVVAKEAVVTGEVVVGKERATERQLLGDTVHREHVEVEETSRRTRAGLDVGEAGRPTAAAIVGRGQVQVGAEVTGSDQVSIGRVKEARDGDFLVDRPRQRDLYVPYHAVRGVTAGRIVLSIPADQVDAMG